MRKLAILLALLTSNAALAVTIVDMPNLPANDRAAINALEQQFFDRVQKDGLDKALTAQFAEAGEAETLSAENHKVFQNFDRSCGTLTSVERYRSETFGSRAVHDHFMTIIGGCVVKFRLSYAKVGTAWNFRGFDFQSSNGSDWTY